MQTIVGEGVHLHVFLLIVVRILAPGNGYTGGHSWTQDYTGNSPASSTVMYKIKDPLNNTGKHVHITHQYQY